MKAFTLFCIGFILATMIRAQVPVISIDPDSLEAGLYTGDTSAGIITVSNTGSGDLTCTISVEPTSPTGSINNALKFDGTNDYVLVNNNSILQLTGQLTIEAWVNFEEGGAGHPCIVSKGRPNPNYEVFFDSTLQSRTIGLTLDQVGTIVSQTILQSGTWYHLAFTYDGALMKIYINGILDKSQSGTGSVGTTNYGLFFGKRDNITTHKYKGELDDVRIWNIARTQEDILHHLNHELSGSETGLAGYWKFNEESGNTAFDATSFANNATLNLGTLRLPSGASIVNWFDASPVSLTVGPGLSSALMVSFDAADLTGTFNGQVNIRSNDPGNALLVVPVEMVVNPIAKINLSVTQLDFGSIYVGASKPMSFMVSNTGNDTLEVISMTCPNADYAIVPLYFSILPGESDTVEISYTPLAPGNDNGTLTILSNDLTSPVVTISLLGTAVPPPVISINPDSLSMNLYSGKTSTQTLTITNSGLSDLDFTIADYALVLDGYEDYVKVGNPSLYTLDQFTLDVWIYKYDYNMEGFIALGNTENERYSLHCGYGNNNMMYWQDVGDNWVQVNTYSFYTGSWIHLAVTHDGSTLRCYTNGNLVNTTPLPSPSLVSSSHFLYFGNQISGNPEYLYGMMDDICIWNYARSEEEIQQDMAGNLTGVETGLVGYWKFDEASGNIAHDASINANDGILYGDASREAMPFMPSWLTITPSSGTCLSGSSINLEVNFDASHLPGGDYLFDMNISSNDPINPSVIVPVTLHVTDAPCILANKDTLDFGILYAGFDVADTLEVQVSNIGSLDLLITGVTTSPEIFSAWPDFAGIDPGDSETFTVVFTLVDVGEYFGTLTFTSNDPLAEEYTVVLKGQYLVPPEIAINPQSLSAVLYSGKTTTQSFTISNSGGSDLDFTITPGEGSQNFALKFDGSDDYINVGDNINLANSSFTLEAWAKEGSGYGYHIMWGQGTPSTDDGLVAGFWDSDVFGFGFCNNDLGTPTSYTDTLWHHWACTFDVSTKVRIIYRDGIAVASDISGTNYQGSGQFYIGKAAWSDNNYFHSCIDDVRLWNVARTQQEIQQNMSHQLLGNEAGLVGYWDFDEGTGLTVYDKSPNGNDGTLINGVTWTNAFGPMSPGWLSVSPENGTLPVNSSLDMEATVDASNLAEGDYLTNIIIYSNDPAIPEWLIPVALQVIDAPSIFAEQDTLDFGEVFTGCSNTLQLVVENTGSLDLLIYSIETDPAEYSVFPPYASLDPGDTEEFLITFLPQAVGDYPGTLTFNCNDPVYSEYTINLEGTGIEPPIIAVTPDSLIVSILPGDSVTEPFTIYNNGGSNLYFTITPGEGIGNYALEFDGVNDYVTVGNPSLYNLDQFTLEAWIYLYDYFSRGSIITLGNAGSERLSPYTDQNNLVYMQDWNGNIQYLTTPGLNINKWEHIAITHNGLTVKSYLDGNVINSAQISSPMNFSNNYTLYFGNEIGGEPEYFHGKMDDIRIWNVAQTQEEIEKNMGSDLLGNETGLVGYWDFDEGTGLTVNDKSPNGNNGTLINGVAWTDATPPMSAAWLSVSQESGTIPANSSITVEAIFNAAELQSGDYFADLRIYSNDPVNPLVIVPVHMIIDSVTGIENSSAGSQPLAINSYPNPFSGTITFEYELQETVPVTFTIFNHLGQEVAVLVNEEQPGGKCQVQWNAENLPPGVYYCLLKTGNQLISKKIIKMK